MEELFAQSNDFDSLHEYAVDRFIHEVNENNRKALLLIYDEDDSGVPYIRVTTSDAGNAHIETTDDLAYLFFDALKCFATWIELKEAVLIMLERDDRGYCTLDCLDWEDASDRLRRLRRDLNNGLDTPLFVEI